MLYLLVYVLLPLMLAGLLFIWAYALLRRRRAVLNTKQLLRLRQLLDSWYINQEVTSRILFDVNKRINTLTASMFLGGGIGVALAGFVMACIGVFTTHTLLAGNSTRGEPFAELMLLFLFVGYWLGDLIGFRRLKQEATHSIVFGDLRRRLSADYRSLLWHIVPTLMATVNTIVAIISLSSLHSSVQMLLMNDTRISWPSWIVLVIPMLMFLLVISAEMGVGSIVRFPRLLGTAEPGLAKRIDDMLRAIMIGSLIGAEYSTVGALQMGQFRLILLSFAGSPGAKVPVALSIWLLFSYLTGLTLAITGPSVAILRGHLGGSVSGWPRRRSQGGIAWNSRC